MEPRVFGDRPSGGSSPGNILNATLSEQMPDPYRRILDALSACRRVLITTHARPDGDALGTAAAMALALRQKKIESDVLLFNRLPRKYAFLFTENKLTYHDVEAGWPKPYPLDKFDALLVVDTGTWSQLPGLRDQLNGWTRPRLILDHHQTQENWADISLVDTKAAAAGEIAAALLTEWEIPIDKSIATALFIAIASDTGWFQFSNTRPATFRLAADLIEAGVDTDSMYQLLYQNERAERLALQSRAQDSLQLLENGRLAVMSVRKKDFDETGASPEDTENLINIPLQIRTVEVSILLTEPSDASPIRVSLRSKGQVDVARFAEQFGGGGHARASGLKIPGPLQEAQDKLVTAMSRSMADSKGSGVFNSKTPDPFE